MYKTLFKYISTGTRFQVPGDDALLVKRSGSNRQTTFCNECRKIVRFNAYLVGIAMVDADNTQRTHMCPLDYVLIRND